MNKGLKKFLLYGLPLIGAAGIIYFLNRKKKPVVPATEADVKDTSEPKPASGFPLKQGSRGDKVKELQSFINTPVDGIFGPDTENALIKFAGVRVVKDSKEFDALKKKAQGQSSSARAADLIKKFNADPSLSMYVIKDAPVESVTIDAYGAVQYLGKYKTFAGGKKYSRNDYILKTATQLGKLIFEINKGTLAGMYIVDPNLISVI